jgi:hypothetical protein
MKSIKVSLVTMSMVVLVACGQEDWMIGTWEKNDPTCTQVTTESISFYDDKTFTYTHSSGSETGKYEHLEDDKYLFDHEFAKDNWLISLVDDDTLSLGDEIRTCEYNRVTD